MEPGCDKMRGCKFLFPFKSGRKEEGIRACEVNVFILLSYIPSLGLVAIESNGVELSRAGRVDPSRAESKMENRWRALSTWRPTSYLGLFALCHRHPSPLQLYRFDSIPWATPRPSPSRLFPEPLAVLELEEVRLV